MKRVQDFLYMVAYVATFGLAMFKIIGLIGKADVHYGLIAYLISTLYIFYYHLVIAVER